MEKPQMIRMLGEINSCSWITWKEIKPVFLEIEESKAGDRIEIKPGKDINPPIIMAIVAYFFLLMLRRSGWSDEIDGGVNVAGLKSSIFLI